MIPKAVPKAFSVLPKKQRKDARLTAGFGLLTALVDVVSVVSVMPFLAVASDPDKIDTSATLSRAYNVLGFETHTQFLVFLGLGCIGFIVAGAILRTISAHKMHTFLHMSRYALGSKLIENYLSQPYPFFLRRNSAAMAKEIFNEVAVVVSQIISPGMSIFVNGVTITLMAILLMLVDPFTTLIAVGLLGSAYFSVYRFVRNRSEAIGRARSVASEARYQAADAALGGAKTVKVMNLEPDFIAQYRAASLREELCLARYETLSQVPRNAIEALALGGVVCIVLTMLMGGKSQGGLSTMLPQLGLFAFAGFRMLPGLQAIYHAFTTIRFAGTGLDRFFSDIILPAHQDSLKRSGRPPLGLARDLEFRGVTYRYDRARAAGLNDISFVIPRGSRVGIIGTTGAGKTTLVDVLLGLLRPQLGAFLVDGVPVDDANLSAWQYSIGYVPQDIYLLDATVAENVAIGRRTGALDERRVKECLRIACILDFVEIELSNGIHTSVGQRGIRLSGGQRQRIGIARALYNDPTVIVFDEATSALDHATELEVMQAITNLDDEKTVVMIAHRLSTVRNCDFIVVMEAGKITQTGAFEELQEQGLISAEG